MVNHPCQSMLLLLLLLLVMMMMVVVVVVVVVDFDTNMNEWMNGWILI